MMPDPRWVILDRDGVINEDSDAYIKSVAEWKPLPGSLEAIARLSRAGWRLAVVSNQSGIGRGLFTAATLDRINAHMLDAVAAAGGRIDGVYVCPHRPDQGCDCRKPEPGLLLRAAADLGFAIEGVPFIGDKQSDIDAARAAGARPMLVRSSHHAAAVSPADDGVECFADLAAAADALLAEAE